MRSGTRPVQGIALLALLTAGCVGEVRVESARDEPRVAVLADSSDELRAPLGFDAGGIGAPNVGHPPAVDDLGLWRTCEEVEAAHPGLLHHVGALAADEMAAYCYARDASGNPEVVGPQVDTWQVGVLYVPSSLDIMRHSFLEVVRGGGMNLAIRFNVSEAPPSPGGDPEGAGEESRASRVGDEAAIVTRVHSTAVMGVWFADVGSERAQMVLSGNVSVDGMEQRMASTQRGLPSNRGTITAEMRSRRALETTAP